MGQLFLPLLIAIGIFALVGFVTRKNLFNNNVFIRLRIVLGCIYIGYLITEISRAESARSVFTMVLLAGIITIGVYKLQKKYFVIKQS